MRKKPNNLIRLESLYPRMFFDKGLYNYLKRLRTGYLFEQIIDEIFETYNYEWIIVKGFGFKEKYQNVFQIDLLIFTGNKVLHYEIKAYKDPVIYRGNIFEIIIKDSNTEKSNENREVITYKNPIEQLNENRIYLAQLFEKLNIELPIESYVIFAHPNYYIYELPAGQPFVFRGQLQNHIEEIKNTISPATEVTQNYVSYLEQHNQDITKDDYQIPNYTFESLGKKLMLPCCENHIVHITKHQYLINCQSCNRRFTMKEIAEHAVFEYQQLFNQSPTLNQLYGWTNKIFSRQRLHSWFYKQKKEG
ncbi:NERD domain-containing protein [Aerococcaceae bacterium DSM 111022]|nr:NERD domain-containing protein [Aerococcaceae bacterium DSM 111022]